MIGRKADVVSKPQAPSFRLRVTRDKLPRLTAWRRAMGRPRKLSPAMRWTGIILWPLLIAVWTANAVLSGGRWGPPMLALAGVGFLFACAATLGWLNRYASRGRSTGFAAWLDGCPSWFERMVLGLIVVTLGAGLYRLLGSLDEGARSVAADLAFDPIMVFTFGCFLLLHLLQMRRPGAVERQR